MNIARHMEAIFVAVLAIAGMTGVATASRPVAEPVVSAQPEMPMQVVTISAKRLSPAEKAAQ